jgi:hypothetical protein
MTAQTAASADWAKSIAAMPATDLIKTYRNEAQAHRSMVLHRGFSVSPRWKDFRLFLADVGPMPAGAILVFTDPKDLNYGPGKTRWGSADEQLVLPQRDPKLQPSKARPAWAQADAEAKPTAEQGLAAAAKRHGISMEALAAGAKGPAPVQAADLIDENAHWLPPEADRRNAFLKAYAVWHSRVLPNFSRSARPSFLYLYTALPVLRDCRETLKGLDLWEPLTDSQNKRREEHAAWKRYCDFLPKVQAALVELDRYNGYSLYTQLDEILAAVLKDEERFRTPPPVKSERAAPKQFFISG